MVQWAILICRTIKLSDQWAVSPVGKKTILGCSWKYLIGSSWGKNQTESNCRVQLCSIGFNWGQLVLYQYTTLEKFQLEPMCQFNRKILLNNNLLFVELTVTKCLQMTPYFILFSFFTIHIKLTKKILCINIVKNENKMCKKLRRHWYSREHFI